jgi:hypothetical protein
MTCEGERVLGKRFDPPCFLGVSGFILAKGRFGSLEKSTRGACLDCSTSLQPWALFFSWP